MHYAITVTPEGVITDCHESITPITAEIFADNPMYAGQTVQVVPTRGEITPGTKIAEYSADWTLKPLVWRVQHGYTPVPDGFELIGDELVPKDVTPEEAPVTMQQQLLDAQTKLAAAETALAESDKTSKFHAAQIKALSDQNELYADLIQELALVAYS